MAQYVSINQMLDNAEAINKPQKVVNVSAIENLSELKYRRDGIIRIKGDIDAAKAVQSLQVPSINTPILVFETLEKIQEKASGVTDIAKGVSEQSGKLGIYEGNLEAINDRFNLLNKSYSFGYRRFAKLYEHGVKENLVKRIAIEILGPDGVDIESINKNDIFKKTDEFGIIVEASTADDDSFRRTQGARIAFLTGITANPNTSPLINLKKSVEIQASSSGFSEDEIRQLLDTSEFGDQELMSEAERDIEEMLDGNFIKPNGMANNAYKQRIVDYMRDHEENITPKQFDYLVAYVDSLTPIIARNEARALSSFATNQANMMARTPMDGNAPARIAGEEGGPMSGRMPQLNEEII